MTKLFRILFVFTVAVCSSYAHVNATCRVKGLQLTVPTGRYFEGRLVTDASAQHHYHLLAVPSEDIERTRASLFEGKDIMDSIRGFPAYWARLGFRNSPEGVHYPNLEELNKRIREVNQESPKWRSPVTVDLDTAAKGIDHVSLARMWIDRKVPVSWLGRQQEYSLHFHDMFFHLPGYLWFPERLHQQSSDRLKALLRVLDHAEAHGNVRLKRWARRNISHLISEIDGISASISLALADRARAPKHQALVEGFSEILEEDFSSLKKGGRNLVNDARRLPPSDQRIVERYAGRLNDLTDDTIRKIAADLTEHMRVERSR